MPQTLQNPQTPEYQTNDLGLVAYLKATNHPVLRVDRSRGDYKVRFVFAHSDALEATALAFYNDSSTLNVNAKRFHAEMQDVKALVHNTTVL